jgi:hypothetical protein
VNETLTFAPPYERVVTKKRKRRKKNEKVTKKIALKIEKKLAE